MNLTLQQLDQSKTRRRKPSFENQRTDSRENQRNWFVNQQKSREHQRNRQEQQLKHTRQRVRKTKKRKRGKGKHEQAEVTPRVFDQDGIADSHVNKVLVSESGGFYEFPSFKGHTVPKHFAENLNNLKVRVGRDVRAFYSLPQLPKSVRKRFQFFEKQE